jgi:hypothetical protein
MTEEKAHPHKQLNKQFPELEREDEKLGRVFVCSITNRDCDICGCHYCRVTRVDRNPFPMER